MTAKRIFDDPNHPQYGPVRRMWVILAQLDLLEFADLWAQARKMTWDGALASRTGFGIPESRAQSSLLYAIMKDEQ